MKCDPPDINSVLTHAAAAQGKSVKKYIDLMVKENLTLEIEELLDQLSILEGRLHRRRQQLQQVNTRINDIDC